MSHLDSAYVYASGLRRETDQIVETLAAALAKISELEAELQAERANVIELEREVQRLESEVQ